MRIIKPTMSIYAEHTNALRVGGEFEVVVDTKPTNVNRAGIIIDALRAAKMHPNKVRATFLLTNDEENEVVMSACVTATEVSPGNWEVTTSYIGGSNQDVETKRYHAISTPHVSEVVEHMLIQVYDA